MSAGKEQSENIRDSVGVDLAGKQKEQLKKSFEVRVLLFFINADARSSSFPEDRSEEEFINSKLIPGWNYFHFPRSSSQGLDSEIWKKFAS